MRGEPYALVEGEGDADLGALRVDRLDLADADAEDSQVGAGVDADGAVEVGGDAGGARVQEADGDEAAGGQHHQGEGRAEDSSALVHRAPLPFAAACCGGRHPVLGRDSSGR